MPLTNRQRDLFIYKSLDYLAALVAWFLFFVYRKRVETGVIDYELIFQDWNLYLGLLLIPIFWLIVYSLFDRYDQLYRLSRISTFFRTLGITAIGTIFLFFTVLVDDVTFDYVRYIKPFIVLFSLHFGLTILFRLAWISLCKRKIIDGSVRFKTVLAGHGQLLANLYHEINLDVNHFGLDMVAYLSDEEIPIPLGSLAYLGDASVLHQVVSDNDIEDIILAFDQDQYAEAQLYLHTATSIEDISIKIIPEMQDLILGRLKTDYEFGAPFIEFHQELMPNWQWALKRWLDISISVVCLLVLSPLFLYAYYRTRSEGNGPIIYRQERIGKHGKPFDILKFRSMVINAESEGPQLSRAGDDRITPWGRTMRKWRIDELPQFVNVLKGDMSLVGPRPERKYFIDLLSRDIPTFRQLLKIRPGITSWGQVKYGYASSLEEMKQRFRFDKLYVENMSLLLDFKILFYTIIVLFQGKGK